MACSLTIDGILGLTSAGQVVRLRVNGTATGCQSVRITVEKSDPVPGIVVGPAQPVAVDSSTQVWSKDFLAPADFPLSGFSCGSTKLTVTAVCAAGGSCSKVATFATLLCHPDGGSCPVFGTPVVTPRDCDAQGRRRVTITVPVSSEPAGATYLWDFGDPAQPFPNVITSANGVVTGTYSYTPPGPFTATLHVASSTSCPSVAVPIGPLDSCGAPPCPDSVTLQVVNIANGQQVDPQQCLPPGLYRVEVTAPNDPGARFSWSINNTLQSGATGSHLDVLVSLGGPSQTITVAVIPSVMTCPVVTGAVTLTFCPIPARVLCPTTVSLKVANTANLDQVVDSSGCMAPGTYRITVTEPTSSGIQYGWSVDGEQVSGATNVTFDFTLADDGASHEISVAVVEGGCPPISAAVTLQSCPCTGSLSLQVTDSAGIPVNTENCVVPGDYMVQANGDNLENSHRQWTIDGRNAGDGTMVPVTVQAATGCGEGTGDTVVALRATRQGCPDQTQSVTLKLCREFALCPGCWALQLFILLALIVGGIALAIWICPPEVVNPFISRSQALAAIAAAVAPWVFAAAMVVAAILIFVWILLCRLTWCWDWLPLIWQLLLGVGFAFMFFGTCPLCQAVLFPIGLALFFLGVLVFIFWIISCKPTTCTIFFEIGSLGLVQVIVSFLEGALGQCVIVWGWLLLLIWTGLLNGLGWGAAVLAGCIKRN